jgi:hypothetical protein
MAYSLTTTKQKNTKHLGAKPATYHAKCASTLIKII